MGKSKSTLKKSIKVHIGTKKYHDLCGRLYMNVDTWRFGPKSSKRKTDRTAADWNRITGSRIYIHPRNFNHGHFQSTVGRISHGTFWFQHALFQNFLKSIYSFPWTLWIFLRWFRGRANHELLIYYINFNPTERILCLKHEKRNKRFKLVGTKTFAADCTMTAENTAFVFQT